MVAFRATAKRAVFLSRGAKNHIVLALRASGIASAFGLALLTASSSIAQAPPPNSPLQKRMALMERQQSHNSYLSVPTVTSGNSANSEYVDIYGVAAYGINDWGVAVGEYCHVTTACEQAVGGTGPFLFANGDYKTLTFPATVLGAYPSGINLLGQIVGVYFDTSFTIHGFVLDGSHFRSIDAPGTAPTGFLGTYTNGINSFQDKLGNTHGYLLSHGVAQVIDFPGSQFTQAWGINFAGDIVGSYSVPVTTNPYTNTYSYGFLLHRGAFSTVNPPGGSSSFSGADTIALGINDIGEIVGVYQRATSVGSAQLTGFLRKW